MTNTDKELFRILNDKLNGLESPVSADVWNGVQQQMGAAGKAAAVKSGFWASKLFIGLAAAAVITGVIVIAALNTEKETKAPIVQASNTSTSQSAQESTAVHTDNSEIVLKNDSTIANKSIVVLESATCDAFPYPVDEMEGKTTYYGREDHNRENRYLAKNSSSPNNSENQNASDNISSSAEPLSAGFHTRCVDAEDMRYFFFPKTDKAKSFKWIVSDGTESSNISLAHVFEKEGTYSITLTATGYDGQVTTESESVSIFKPVLFKIPTAISPGTSGKNDIIDFEEAIENEKSIEYLVILNKEGKVVYESKNTFNWNGYDSRQELCPAGVYSYVVIAIDGGNKSQTNKGTIQLFHE